MNSLREVRRLLFWLFGLPLAALLLMSAALAFAVSTEIGLRGLLAVAERAAPGRFSVGAVHGRLLGPLRIEQLRYQDGPLQLTLAGVDFDWRPTDLITGLLNITRLHFNGLYVQLPPGSDAPPTPAEPSPPVLPDVRLPLAVAIGDMQGRDFSLQLPDAEPIRVDALNLKARAEADGLNIEVLEAWAPLGELHLSGRLHPVGAYPLQLRLDWQVITPEHGTFAGRGEIDGELRDRLHLVQNISGAAALELRGEVHKPLDPQPAWSAQAKLTVADLKPFAPEWAGRPLTARLDAQGVLTQFQGQGEIAAALPELGAATLRFSAVGNEQSIKLNELRLTAADRPLLLNAHGEVLLAELRFDAGGQWQSLAWPLTGSPRIESAQGEFAVKGTVQDYRFQLAADVQGPDIPKGRWTLSGQGSDQAVRDVKLNGRTLDGAVQGDADVAWLPAVRWQAQLSGAGLNPGAQWPDAPGKLDVRLKSDGVLENGVLKVNALLEELAGTFRGQTVRGTADAAIQDQHLTLKALRLSAGDAQVQADGSLAQRWDLRWKLEVPRLQTLLPNLSGAITAGGALSGPRDRPAVAANFSVRNLRQGDTQIQQLRGEADVDVGGGNRSQLKMTGDGLTLGGQNWKSFTLDGSGTPAAHDLKAELIGDAGRFLLALTGSLQTPSLLWQGRITQLSGKDTVAGSWNLDQPTAIRASNRQAGVDAVCLNSAPTRICLQGQWDAAAGFNGRVQLNHLASERFKNFLPPGLNLATGIGGDAAISGKPGGPLQGKLNLNIAPGHVQMEAEGRPVRFTLNGGGLQGELNGRSLNLQSKLDLAQTGQLQANLQIQDPFATAKINGRINAVVTDLSVASLLAPQLQKVSGQLKADVGVAGDLSKLTLRGAIRLENAGAAIPEAGLKLQDVQLAVVGNGQGPLQLSGSARSGSGALQLSGDVDPLKPQLNLSIKGQNFQALDTSDMRIRISPDLTLAVARQQVRVEGELTVPQAFLRPGGDRPGVIKASDDVVIVNNRNGDAPPKPKNSEIYAKVRVVLGDDVQLETSAFKGKLRGGLLVEETPQLAPRGSGGIEVVAGNYRIYGEEIQIQRGQLLFSSSPLDNPGLDLRVARQVQNSTTSDSITAGAHIRGTLKKPQMVLFSEPKMPDADVLSYLVLGRSPQSGGSESALLFKAANAAGLGGGALTKSLGDTFGLDSLQLSSGSGRKEDTSLMLGKYLSPDLYVGYGIGLFNAVNTFNIKYRLSKRLMFESNSSAVGAGADLIYTIER